MKSLGLKEWFLFSIPPLLMGLGLGLSFTGSFSFVCLSPYFFLLGVILEIPTLWLIYKHNK